MLHNDLCHVILKYIHSLQNKGSDKQIFIILTFDILCLTTSLKEQM